MPREQWVNLTVDDEWLGDGVSQKDALGPKVRLEIRFNKKGTHAFYLSKEADGGNAAYSDAERRGNPFFRPRTFTRRRFVTASDGTLRLRVPLTLAGGDKYKFTVEDRKGNKKSIEYETRRKLYYQALSMHGARPVSGSTMQDFKDRFWNEGKKLYVKMVQVPGGKPIIGFENVDVTDNARVDVVREQSRLRWKRAKSPHCFVIVFVRKMCLFGDEEGTLGSSIPSDVMRVTTSDPLASVADAGVEFFGELIWIPDGEFAIYTFTRDKVHQAGDNVVLVDTSHLPKVRGRLSYRMRVVSGQLGGVSYVHENLVIVATEYHDGEAKPASKVLHVINHEVGHKIGMVPRSQSTFYERRGHQGPHCYNGTALIRNFRTGRLRGRPNCVMFGSTASRTPEFCPHCTESLRKLDLRASANPGLRTPF